jgi:hypothetical protein
MERRTVDMLIKLRESAHAAAAFESDEFTCAERLRRVGIIVKFAFCRDLPELHAEILAFGSCRTNVLHSRKCYACFAGAT